MVANFHDAAGVRERRGLGSGLDQPAGWHSLSLAEPSRTFGSQAHTLGWGDDAPSRCDKLEPILGRVGEEKRSPVK